MSFEHLSSGDPLEFVRNMWGSMGFNLPGMVAPTFDVEELDKRIADLKAVEGWLRMNLSMLQMTIQNMEMQKATLSAVQAMGSMAATATKGMTDAASAANQANKAPAGEAVDALSQSAMWPWNMMQQMQEHIKEQVGAATAQSRTTKAKRPARKATRS